jgi:hypothetical protein
MKKLKFYFYSAVGLKMFPLENIIPNPSYMYLFEDYDNEWFFTVEEKCIAILRFLKVKYPKMRSRIEYIFSNLLKEKLINQDDFLLLDQFIIYYNITVREFLPRDKKERNELVEYLKIHKTKTVLKTFGIFIEDTTL